MSLSTLSRTTAFHLSLNARDLAASTDFYRRLFDVDPVKTKADYVKFELNDPPLVLSLVPATATPAGPRRVSHLGLRVPDARALEEARRRLGQAQLVSEDEGQVTCCYAVQDKLWSTDPDGNSWEVYRFLADSPSSRDETTVCCPDSACGQ